MDTDSDLTFITNEEGRTLRERFNALFKSTQFFDVLVGYFYTSGFYQLYESLEKTEKIRILIGISTNKEAVDLIEESRQPKFEFSHWETKEHFSDLLIDEMEKAEDSKKVEEGVKKFIEWLKSGKLEIKVYPTKNIHAKLYIMSFVEDSPDVGRIITGSSNFTQSGLRDNLEFNVELKDHSDYDFAKQKFEELWKDGVDVKEIYTQTIREKTWLNDNITPYELYLKFLYEYFKDDLELMDKVDSQRVSVPDGFKQLEYQEQAVINANKILEEYGGVFISDVVGLGKTYVSAMLAKQLDGKTVVLAPPSLIDKANPDSWRNVFLDFDVAADCESIGKLDNLIDRGTEKYKNVFIDEAHRFRTESNASYEKLAQICRGKRVVLVTATPLNNSPNDILSQIKLFQNARKSTIPNVPNLESFFGDLQESIKKLDRRKNRDNYIKTTKKNAQKIRESVLKYLMVRRTRNEIQKYFANDLKNQGVKFPNMIDPEPVYYQLNEKENTVFNETVRLVTEEFQYTRYMLMDYYKYKKKSDSQAQINMRGFIKVLLIKRLESSFDAFKKTIERFILHHKKVLKYSREDGVVYISKGYTSKIFELHDGKDDEAIEKLLTDNKAERYQAKDFTDKLESNLEKDISILEKIKESWEGIERDPKLLSLVNLISTRSILKKNKLIIFTESKETAEYLAENIKGKLKTNEVIALTGSSEESTRRVVLHNFNPNVHSPKDDYRILIATEVLSEGVSLNRSNVVINYDIPWNPTRLMQRVGRINRVGTSFDKIYSFNFFPTEQSNDQIKLKEFARAKIEMFISLLGADSRFLTDEEVIESHELFDRLFSEKTITGEDEEGESELKYLNIIKDIRANDPDLFEKVKRLPKKARTAKKHAEKRNQLLTYFRKGKLQKFFITGKEINFMDAASLLESQKKTRREKIPSDFYSKLEKNKQEFNSTTTEDTEEIKAPRGSSNAGKLLKILKAMENDSKQYTEDQEQFLNKVIKSLEEGALPKNTVRRVLKELEAIGEPNSLKRLKILQNSIPKEFLESPLAESVARTSGPREVILSEYLVGE